MENTIYYSDYLQLHQYCYKLQRIMYKTYNKTHKYNMIISITRIFQQRGEKECLTNTTSSIIIEIVETFWS